MQYKYEVYNPGQFPEHHQSINQMAADGWTVHTASPNYSELYVLWEKADVEPPAGEEPEGERPAVTPPMTAARDQQSRGRAGQGKDDR